MAINYSQCSPGGPVKPQRASQIGNWQDNGFGSCIDIRKSHGSLYQNIWFHKCGGSTQYLDKFSGY